VIGSSIKTRFEMNDGAPTLFRLPDINFIDDKTGKPIGINEHIGRRPIAAFGNSDGDLEMLQWTTLGADGARFGLIVHHTDAEREYAYDRHSHFGKLDVALDAAAVNKWTVVDRRRTGSASLPSNDVGWRAPRSRSRDIRAFHICSSTIEAVLHPNGYSRYHVSPPKGRNPN
jgi:hypothetical protein